MNTNKFWTNIFVWGTTTFIFALYITAVFFSIEGNWSFLSTIDYWSEILIGTSLAFVLRFMWSLKGVDIALFENEKIRSKESEKATLIQQITQGKLIGKLDKLIVDTNLENKQIAYRNKCDKKVKFFSSKIIPFHNKFREKWELEKENTFDDEFNWDNVKVKYYEYKQDNLLSSYFKGDDSGDGDTSNTTLLGITVLSMRTNMFTVLAMILFTAIELIKKDFNTNELYILFGKIIIFMMNMNNGFGLGKKYINVLYNRQLTKDYTFMKTFLDNNIVS